MCILIPISTAISQIKKPTVLFTEDYNQISFLKDNIYLVFFSVTTRFCSTDFQTEGCTSVSKAEVCYCNTDLCNGVSPPTIGASVNIATHAASRATFGYSLWASQLCLRSCCDQTPNSVLKKSFFENRFYFLMQFYFKLFCFRTLKCIKETKERTFCKMEFLTKKNADFSVYECFNNQTIFIKLL